MGKEKTWHNIILNRGDQSGRYECLAFSVKNKVFSVTLRGGFIKWSEVD